MRDCSGNGRQIFWENKVSHEQRMESLTWGKKKCSHPQHEEDSHLKLLGIRSPFFFSDHRYLDLWV